MNVAIIGLGLIGGSLLRALAAHGHQVTGYDIGLATRQAATALAGAAPSEVASAEAASAEAALAEAAPAGRPAWHVAGSIPAAVEGADVVVLAVPLPVLPDVLAELDGFPGVITDVTSVKGPVRDLLKGRRYVGGHPMAGKEESSFLASDPHLFDRCAWVLCLDPETSMDDWLSLAALYTSIGARVVPAGADEHDEAVARISHVPHLLAAALANLIDGHPLAAALAAGSFRDGTRVAATRAELIAAMCGGNAAAVRRVLPGVLEDLGAYAGRLAEPEPVAELTPLLRRPGELRRGWPVAECVPVEIEPERDALLSLGRAGGWVERVGAKVAGMRPETDRNRS
ncbi:prephenate dehydrogenase/arogenate dehydrogenase family protein [Couchioplanes caeruleus]|uniref:Prephenate dehydrogenase n=2 Tax=Couchioplanes caeruleus TaxID=56438 RepID=A0A1K0GCB0_9ACTN|nr:prephenate dehydrogenase/arogenate dehydrogenase family protein [Couchioplanes caeruleus]OJF09798.1 prephenate dehydrogenase [Couchioplanes caeruleus subsp. caeruleus]ROP31422.1 prephenate dehydrogenase [Couchioplanes caeruleus]